MPELLGCRLSLPISSGTTGRTRVLSRSRYLRTCTQRQKRTCRLRLSWPCLTCNWTDIDGIIVTHPHAVLAIEKYKRYTTKSRIQMSSNRACYPRSSSFCSRMPLSSESLAPCTLESLPLSVPRPPPLLSWLDSAHRRVERLLVSVSLSLSSAQKRPAMPMKASTISPNQW